MRLMAALALLGLWTAQAQPAADTESNTQCIERLRMPVYPKLADAARISGSLTATVVLGPDGSIQNTVLDMGLASATAKRMFPRAVEEALRASAFRKACGGRSVTLVFNFVLGEELDPNHLPQAVSFGYPNRFWISVPPNIVQP
jgi:outer membrane biosynthesis protein TonB